MIKGCEIDPSLLFDEANEVQEEDDSTDDSTKGGSGVIVGGGLTTDSNASTTSEKKTLYRLISESDVEVAIIRIFTVSCYTVYITVLL